MSWQPGIKGDTNQIIDYFQTHRRLTPSMKSQLERLPADVLRIIFSQLDGRALLNLTRVNKQFKALIMNDPYMSAKVTTEIKVLQLVKTLMPKELVWKREPIKPPKSGVSDPNDSLWDDYSLRLKVKGAAGKPTLEFTNKSDFDAEVSNIVQTTLEKKASLFSKGLNRHELTGINVTYSTRTSPEDRALIQQAAMRVNEIIQARKAAAEKTVNKPLHPPKKMER